MLDKQVPQSCENRSGFVQCIGLLNIFRCTKQFDGTREIFHEDIVIASQLLDDRAEFGDAGGGREQVEMFRSYVHR
jgi:hypothetical protein